MCEEAGSYRYAFFLTRLHFMLIILTLVLY